MADWFRDHVFIAQWLVAAGAVSAVLFALFGQHALAWVTRPRLQVEFQPVEPYVRKASVWPDDLYLNSGEQAYDLRLADWYRVKVSNLGVSPARAVIGKVTSIRTAGKPRNDVDPLQLRWAGVPQDHGFDPVHLARGVFEYLNVAILFNDSSELQLVTTTRDLGFRTKLAIDLAHEITVTLTSDNARPVSFTLTLPISG